MENTQNNTFHYTYSAKEQTEIRKIRSKYLPKEENKLERLQHLDASVAQKATMHALIVGLIGALTLGIGMCCCMIWPDVWFVPGIVIGLLGMAIVAAVYPMYTHMVKKERERIAPEILRLADELMR